MMKTPNQMKMEAQTTWTIWSGFVNISDGLMQACGISTIEALEIMQSCTRPSKGDQTFTIVADTSEDERDVFSWKQ